ncbi:hypothetical protein LQE88_08055 [Acidaminococcus sp. NSJ-142]|jgi:hypothetical protein|uniref:hypothetical protein n=1 Tax=Acidaminococcus TaxID=904 RepID=UPI000CFA727D|nr:MULTISPECIES: hypothetical protein [Acidaminococcus]MCD2435937.1 hypothetical protein [Acidaminococcus hominis]MCH4096593.1 hypothetical protein [Acidaminococcus provencensis]RHK02558.1 hypothetical protein DW089_03265 [Acidaminococcus sp. AM05-11]
MTGERRLQAGLLAALLAASLLTGCGSSTGSQSTASSKGTEAASTQEKLLTSPAPSQETKTLAPGEGERGARVEFVTREHKMERITFSGGYLRTLPEEKPDTIMRAAPAGSLGMIFGKREINGLEWAKVATRDGVTAWYAAPAREGALKEDKRPPLQIAENVYRSTYPQVTGEVPPRVQDRINQELGNYYSVYRHVIGPVGGELQCKVTYNRRGLLSLVFTGKPIRYRTYPVSEVNNLASWSQLKKYVYVSPLIGGSDPNSLTAERTDLQYGMVFDLNTGSRLTYEYFLGKNREAAVKERLAELGSDARLDPDNFYVDDQGKLIALASVQQPEPGRVPLDLSDLVVRDY